MSRASIDLTKLDTLAELVKRTAGNRFRGYKLIVLQHTLKDTLLFLSHLRKVIDICAYFPIPYSIDSNIIPKIRSLGIEIFSSDINNEASIKSELNILFSKYKKDKFIIHEIGGYFSFLCNPLNWDLSSRIAGVIEDTTFGLRRYQSFKELPFPVFHVAKSCLKVLEANEVGFSIAHAIISDLNEIGLLTKSLLVLVIGYGDIGAAVAKALRGNGFSVSVFDKKITKMLLAKFEGYEIGEKDTLLKRADVVVGATGEQTIGKRELLKVKSGTIIGSGSSKQIEIDVPFLEKNSKAIIKLSEGITKYVLNKGPKIYLLRNGFPVNFAYKSVPIQVMDLVMSEIYLCMIELTKSTLSPGLRTLDDSSHEMIADIWLRKTNSILY